MNYNIRWLGRPGEGGNPKPDTGHEFWKIIDGRRVYFWHFSDWYEFAPWAHYKIHRFWSRFSPQLSMTPSDPDLFTVYDNGNIEITRYGSDADGAPIVIRFEYMDRGGLSFDEDEFKITLHTKGIDGTLREFTAKKFAVPTYQNESDEHADSCANYFNWQNHYEELRGDF